MKFTFTKSQFEMPDGKYLAKFLGVTLKELQPGETPRLGMDGKPMPPAMTWDFEIIEGPTEKLDPANVGKKADKLTGRIPTPRSGCGKMLAAIADTVLKDGIEVDIAHYVGKQYRITISENRVCENPGPVRVYDQNGTAPAPAATAAPSTNGSGQRWDLSDGQNKLADQTTEEVLKFLSGNVNLNLIRAKHAGAPPATAKLATEWPEFSGVLIPW